MNGRLFWLTLAGAAVVTVAATAISWLLFVNPIAQAVRTGTALQAEFAKILNLTPRISANNAVIFAQNTPTLELVTAKRNSLVRHRVEQTWLHSTKTFEAQARFTAKGGFLLRDAFVVNVRKGGRLAEIRLPKPKILSLEMGDLQILADEDGLWNKLSAADREKAIRGLKRTAKEEFLKTDFLEFATEEARRQIREIVAAAGCEAVFLPPLPEQQEY